MYEWFCPHMYMCAMCMPSAGKEEDSSSSLCQYFVEEDVGESVKETKAVKNDLANCFKA